MILSLTLPPSVNEAYIRPKFGGKYILSDKARAWRTEAIWWLRQYSLIAGKVEVDAIYIFPDKRRRDFHNYSKLLYDALQEARIIEDDSLIVKETSSVMIRKGMAGVLFEVKEINEQ